MKRIAKVPQELRELAPGYLESRKRDYLQLKDAVTRNDFVFLETTAHKTKGTAGSYGFAELGSIAYELENAAKSKDLNAAALQLEKMKTYLDQVEIV